MNYPRGSRNIGNAVKHEDTPSTPTTPKYSSTLSPPSSSSSSVSQIEGRTLFFEDTSHIGKKDDEPYLNNLPNDNDDSFLSNFSDVVSAGVRSQFIKELLFDENEKENIEFGLTGRQKKNSFSVNNKDICYENETTMNYSLNDTLNTEYSLSSDEESENYTNSYIEEKEANENKSYKLVEREAQKLSKSIGSNERKKKRIVMEDLDRIDLNQISPIRKKNTISFGKFSKLPNSEPRVPSMKTTKKIPFHNSSFFGFNSNNRSNSFVFQNKRENNNSTSSVPNSSKSTDTLSKNHSMNNNQDFKKHSKKIVKSSQHSGSQILDKLDQDEQSYVNIVKTMRMLWNEQQQVNQVNMRLNYVNLFANFANVYKNHKLQLKCNEFEEDIKTGKKVIGDLKGQVDEQNNEIDSLKTNISVLEEDLSNQKLNLELTTKKYYSSITELQNTLSTHRKLIGRLESNRMKGDFAIDTLLFLVCFWFGNSSLIQKLFDMFYFVSNVKDKNEEGLLPKRVVKLIVISLRTCIVFFSWYKSRGLAMEYGVHGKIGSVTSYGWTLMNYTMNTNSLKKTNK